MSKNKGFNGFEKFMWLCFCFFAGAVVFYMSSVSEDHWFILIISGLFLFASLVSLFTVIISNIIMPHIAKKKTAVRALGKEGIKLVRHDEVAKLAYKGIYNLLDGKLPQAEEYLQQALSKTDVRQNQMFCIEWLIRLYEAMGNESKMLWCYRKAAEYAPDDAEAQSRLGHAYFSAGKLDRAMYCFEQALRYDPNNGYSYFSIAKIQMIRGEDEKAYETLQTLMKINENHPLCHAELADYYAMQGDADKAAEECKKAQLCGIKEPEELNRRINAMLSFHKTDYDEKNLPEMFYRKIEPKTDDNTNNTENKEKIDD